MHARSAVAVLAIVSAVPFVVATAACGGGSASASASTAPTDTGPLVTAPQGYPTAYPTATAPATAGTVPSTGSATPVLPVAAAAIGPLLTQMGQSEAPGAAAEGMPIAGQFAQGQTLEQPISILGNRCYTIVGASLGIQQLDIMLVVQPTPVSPPMVVAQSSGGGANPVLGGKATGCWRNPTPLTGTGKVILRATSGQGLAAAQVLSKL